MECSQSLSTLCVHAGVYVCTCTRTCVSGCMPVRARVYMHACTYVCVHVPMFPFLPSLQPVSDVFVSPPIARVVHEEGLARRGGGN